MSAALYDTLRAITTATITTMLLKKGIRRCWMNGPQPLVPGGGRLVGPAFTLRFVPVREDLATPESWAKPISTRGPPGARRREQAAAARSSSNGGCLFSTAWW